MLASHWEQGVSGGAGELGKAQQRNQQDPGPDTKEKSSGELSWEYTLHLSSVDDVLCQKESPSRWLGTTSVCAAPASSEESHCGGCGLLESPPARLCSGKIDV